VEETVVLLSARSPKLGQALRRARQQRRPLQKLLAELAQLKKVIRERDDSITTQLVEELRHEGRAAMAACRKIIAGQRTVGRQRVDRSQSQEFPQSVAYRRAVAYLLDSGVSKPPEINGRL
jgi:hypothetical protein